MSKDEFPRSSDTILSNSYMITSKTDKILIHGGFKIKGWIMSGQDQGQEQGFNRKGLIMLNTTSEMHKDKIRNIGLCLCLCLQVFNFAKHGSATSSNSLIAHQVIR